MPSQSIVILGIESSCDDTGASVICDGKLLSNCIANQLIHQEYGGVVPELASRAHQQNIVPVVHQALKAANIQKNEISGIAFTRGPGLLGSLLVGSSFAKGMALGLQVPLIEVNHMQGHVLAHFIKDHEDQKLPDFPFLCLTVSGGHTQIVRVDDFFKMEIIGETRDDAAGEAFDKAAKIMGLPYPGGPLIDKYAKQGDPHKFKFPSGEMPGLDFSFSGLKTSFQNLLVNTSRTDALFIEQNKFDLAASLQYTIINMLMKKLVKASEETGIRQVALAGGVSANSGLRAAIIKGEELYKWKTFIPKFEYCTDNAAMIAMTGYLKFKQGIFSDESVSASARMNF